jgi:molybdenum cofactor guanylyltransferase
VTTAAATGPGSFDAVVLAGGQSRRLGGTDKVALEVGGVPLLDRVLGAVAGAGQVVVVGPRRPTAAPVVWTREEPPGGGPAAGLAAGLRHVDAPAVVVLAGDLPFVDRRAVDALRTAAADRDGALLVDDDGHEQVLAGCWSTAALRQAVHDRGELAGSSVRAVLAGLDRARVRVHTPGPPPWLDCDTTDDLRAARERA